MPLELFNQRSHFKNDVIFVDGLWGSGKSLLAPIITSLKDVEKAQFNSQLDYPLQLYALNRIGFDEACALTSLGIDLASYNVAIGRSINMRWDDWSGLNFNTSGLRYIKRLFVKEGDSVLNNYSQRQALLLISHYIFPALDVLHSSLYDRLRYILVLRDPLLAFTHWHSYFQRFLSPREFTLSVSYEKSKIPWFCAEHSLGNTDPVGSIARTVFFLTAAYANLLNLLNQYENSNSLQSSTHCKILTFDQICYETPKVLNTLSDFLGRTYSRSLQQVLIREKLPRLSQAQGRGFSSYGFNDDSRISDDDQKKEVLSLIESSTDSRSYDYFLHICSEYQDFVDKLRPSFGQD